VSKPQEFTVTWAEVAEQDLLRIVEYIAIDSVIDAFRALDRIKQQAVVLIKFSERSRVIPELASQGIYTYREKVAPPWRLIYRIAGKQVHVLEVVDSRRNLEDVLLERLVGVE
jgi:toxin ParE1/3/4